MNAHELLEILNSFPEIQVLLDCSRRLGMRFGLRGGVLRNIVMSEGLPSAKYDSLYAFVDPFGDIDLVVPNETDQNRLVRALFAEVPFADCHLWDFQTERSAEQAVTKNGTVMADRLILWIDDKLSLGTMGSDIETILNKPAQGERMILQVEADIPAVQLLRTIKYARIHLQSPVESRGLSIDLANLLDRLAGSFKAWVPGGRRQPLWRRGFSRLEIEMAQLLLNAANWRKAAAFLGKVARSVPGEWLGGSDALAKMFSPELESYPRVGVSVYRPRARASLRLDVMTADPDAGPSGDPYRSRIPWTRLALSNLNQATCCPYSDFEEGIAVVAWRNSEPEATHGDQGLQEQEYGVVARPVVPKQRIADLGGDEDLIPISGYTRKGTSIAIRIDPAYLKLITGGRFSTFLVGLVPISPSGNIPATERAAPKTRSPEGKGFQERFDPISR